jgi:hypothetical protein
MDQALPRDRVRGLDLSEIQAPEDATGTRSGITAEWAREFPSEHVWTLRKAP